MAPGLWVLTRPRKSLGANSWDLSQQVSSPAATPEPDGGTLSPGVSPTPRSRNLNGCKICPSSWVTEVSISEHLGQPSFYQRIPLPGPSDRNQLLRAPELQPEVSPSLRGLSESSQGRGKAKTCPPLSYTPGESVQFSCSVVSNSV